MGYWVSGFLVVRVLGLCGFSGFVFLGYGGTGDGGYRSIGFCVVMVGGVNVL